MRTLYEFVRPLPLDESGWLADANRQRLTALMLELQPSLVVELGSYCGLSARLLAGLLPPGGLVVAVDHWTAPNPESLARPEAEWCRSLPNTYHRFLSNVVAAGLQDRILPVRMGTLEAALALDVTAGLIYVDAGHGTREVMEDVLAWWPRLAAGGVLCGDDYGFPAVRLAVEGCAQILGTKARVTGGFWEFAPKE